VVIGISTGGPHGLKQVIPHLSADFSVPVAIVLHMPVGYTELYAQSLNTLAALDVAEAHEGDIVQPGKVMFEIARAGVTEILVPLDEKNLAAVAPGQTAHCVADAYPTEAFTARVSLITPKIDPLRGTVDIRLAVDAVPAFLLQDMTVSVNIETARRGSAIAVPNDALQPGTDGSATVIAVRDGRAERVAVEVGLRGLTQSEITRGLSAGDIVLADPGFAGRRVRASVQAAPAQAANAVNRGPLTPE
jgi:HlyD family secretion protein